MVLGGEDGSSSQIEKVTRVDEDLPWVLDPQRLANWSDDTMYELEVSFREWLFKAMKNTSWKVPKGKGKWNIGSRMTFDKVREQFNIGPQNSTHRSLLGKLCRHYCTQVRVTKGGIAVKGKKHSDVGFYFPRDPHRVKPPYNLRLRFELLMAEGKVVTLKNLAIPRRAEQTVLEMHQTRRLQNQKISEYHQRWKKKYGGKYEYGKKSDSANEDPNGGG